MIQGVVTRDDMPTIKVTVAGQEWSATIDTGFNGDLELPEALKPDVNPRFFGEVRSTLGGGQEVVEDSYLVDFPFDGRVIRAEATFVSGAVILIGAHFLREYRLEINFVTRTVLLERVP